MKREVVNYLLSSSSLSQSKDENKGNVFEIKKVITVIEKEKIKVKENNSKNGKNCFVYKFIKRVPNCSKFQAEQLLFF
jgi:hypothetical protein